MSFIDNGYSKRARNLLLGSPAGASGGDPFFSDVVLLVNFDNSPNAATIVDQSNWQGLGSLGSVGIVAGAAIGALGPPFLGPSYNATHILPDVGAFSSSTRFKRASGEAFTLEFWYYLETIANALPSTFLFDMSFAASAVRMIAFCNAESPANGNLLYLQPLTFNMGPNFFFFWNFVQLTIQPGTDVCTIDLNGVEVASQTANIETNAGVQTVRLGGTANANALASTWALGPVRITKGRARPRGVIPSALFPTF